MIVSRWMLALVAVLVIASCSNDSSAPEDRRFATDPTEEGAEPTVTATATQAPPTVVVEPTASPASILKTRGAPDTVYSLRDNTITSVTLAGDKPTMMSWAVAEDEEIVAIDDAPDGSQVAALVVTPDAGATLRVFSADGMVAHEFERLLDLTALSATPVSDGTGGVFEPDMDLSVSWSPLGDRILAAASDGQLRSVPADGGDPTVLEADIDLNGLESARWSPEGNVIGALIRDASGIGKVYSLALDGDRLTSSELVSAENSPEANSVEQFAWSADGSSILYVVADRDDGTPVGGQLYNWNLDEDQPTLVTTSGRGGPSGTIASFRSSPDGRSVAVVIAVRDGGSLTFHSLLVKSLRTGTSYDVPVQGVNEVPGVWWVSDGLVWDGATSSGDRFVLSKPNGEAVELDAATPVSDGSPVPEATPDVAATPATRG